MTMNNPEIGRRSFIQGVGLAALSAAGLLDTPFSQAQVAVPNSTGTELPKLKAPALACDCHHHIYDPARFAPLQPGVVPDARVQEYRLLQRRIGTTRNVVVTPRPYVTDNRVTLDAISQLGSNARGVAVIHPTVTDVELKALDGGGIRGIRFSLSANPNTTAATTVDMIEPLSKRVNALGWHVQIAMDPDQIVAAEPLWNRIPSVIVFDHMGYVPEPMGTKHPAFALIRRLIDKGRTWVKLSVIPANTKDGPPSYADVNKVGQAYAQAAPERMVGEATGHILTKTTHRMTLCSWICLLSGHPTRRPGTAFSLKTLKLCMALQSLRKVSLNSTNHLKLLDVLYPVTLVAAIIVWVILYGRGVVFRFGGVYTTPGIVVLAAMIVADVLIFLAVSRTRN